MTAPTIIERGRGPEIAGTRITVYDVMDYARMGWANASIALSLSLSSSQVEAALAYIEANRTAVEAEYEKILERSRRGNPPEVEAIVQANRPRFLAKVEAVRQAARAKREASAAAARAAES